MVKVLGTVVTVAFLAVFAFQFVGVTLAKSDKNEALNPLTSPLTSPLSSPCKPGNGFGDKNHCHYGPPGLVR